MTNKTGITHLADFTPVKGGAGWRQAYCTCGWKGPVRSSASNAASDARDHEGSAQ